MGTQIYEVGTKQGPLATLHIWRPVYKANSSQTGPWTLTVETKQVKRVPKIGTLFPVKRANFEQCCRPTSLVFCRTYSIHNFFLHPHILDIIYISVNTTQNEFFRILLISAPTSSPFRLQSTKSIKVIKSDFQNINNFQQKVLTVHNFWG